MGQLNPVTIDFETYYTTVDNGAYTLSRMTTEEYVRDPRFEIIGVSIKHGDAPSKFYTGDLDYIRAVLRQIDWASTMAIGHNLSEFDSLILTQVVGVRPRAYACTLQMARALHGSKDSGGKNISNSLDALCKMYGLAPKGNQVKTYVNRRRESFSPAEMADYAEYCGNKAVTGTDGDTDLCWELFKRFVSQLPRNELQLASLTTRMFAEPRLALDLPLLQSLQQDMATRKAELLTRVAGILGVDESLPQEQRVAQTQSLLRKDEVLASVLRDQFDVTPPTKLSLKRKNPDGSPMVVYAFAKTDEGMSQLLEFEDESDPQGAEDIQALAAARLGVKSTLAESRVDRFTGVANRGLLPVPLAYGKTGTHRLAGSQKINMQNLSGSKYVTKRTPRGALVMTPGGPNRLDQWRMATHPESGVEVMQVRCVDGTVWWTEDAKGEKLVWLVGLRDAITAPPGKKLVVADSSQIELRVCHLLSGQMDTVEELRQGIDVYSSFASTIYGRSITKKDKRERQHGKVGMLQLQYQSGWKSFRNAARIMGGVRLTEDEAAGTVDTYRNRFTEVRKFWRTCQQGISKMATGGGTYLDQWGLCKLEHNRITSPGRMPLVYHNLRQELLEGFDGGEPELQWVYDDKEKRSMRKIYGGSVTENLCQWLARNVVFDQMLECEKRWGRYDSLGNGVVLTVHDEIVLCVDEDDAEEALKFCLDTMSQPPKWWPQLPVAAEGGIGQRYSEAK